MTSAKHGKKRMSQSDIYNHFAQSKGMKKAEVKEFFDQLSALAAREVNSNREFVLPGFGKLVKAERKARQGRNPLTGASIQIPSKRVLKFRLGKDMKMMVLRDPATRPDYKGPAEGEPVTPPDY